MKLNGHEVLEIRKQRIEKFARKTDLDLERYHGKTRHHEKRRSDE